jgi:hypothetical protein
VSDVAVISVVVTGAVALGTPLINGLLAASQNERAARSDRLDELRSVLDDAATALLRFTDSIPQVEDTPGGPFSLVHLLPRMKSALTNISEQEARIGVRLGVESEVFKAYRAAHDAAGNYYTHYREKTYGSNEPQNLGLDEIGNKRADAFRRFFDLAAALTGPDRT